MSTMKAQVFYNSYNLKLEDVNVPEIGDDELLIKVKAVGICGSDIAYYTGKSPVDTPNGKGPLILGHEISGEIVDMGTTPKNLHLFEVGSRVVINPAHACQTCRYCLRGQVNLCEHLVNVGVSANGGFAEYVKAKYTNVFKIPYTVSYEQAAMIEPLACAINGINNLDIQVGDVVVVIGSGPIGLMMVQMAKAKGAGRVILVGIMDFPLAVARGLGADLTLNTMNATSPYYTKYLYETIFNLTNGYLADKVIVPTGSIQAMQQAMEISGKKSTVVYFGLPGENDCLSVPVLSTLQMDKTIRFSWLAPLTWPTAIQAVDTGLVNVTELITHRYSLEELPEAISFMASKQEEKIKGLVFV